MMHGEIVMATKNQRNTLIIANKINKVQQEEEEKSTHNIIYRVQLNNDLRLGEIKVLRPTNLKE
jgi:GTP-binding protein EngB required for normal cell division